MDAIATGTTATAIATAGQARFDARLTAMQQAAESAAAGLNDIASMTDRDQQLRAVSNEFAALMLGMMFKEMVPNRKAEGIGFGGAGEEIFRDMQTEQFARNIAARDTPGSLSDIVHTALSKKVHTGTRARAAEAAYARAMETGDTR